MRIFIIYKKIMIISPIFIGRILKKETISAFEQNSNMPFLRNEFSNFFYDLRRNHVKRDGLVISMIKQKIKIKAEDLG